MKIYIDPKYKNEYEMGIIKELEECADRENAFIKIINKEIDPEMLYGDNYYLTKEEGINCYSSIFDLYNEISGEINRCNYDELKELPKEKGFFGEPVFRDLVDYICYVGYIKEQDLYPARAVLVDSGHLPVNAETAFGSCCKIENNGDIRVYSTEKVGNSYPLLDELDNWRMEEINKYTPDEEHNYMPPTDKVKIYIDEDVYRDESYGKLIHSLNNYFKENDINSVKFALVNTEEMENKKLKDLEYYISKDNYTVNIFKIAPELDYASHKKTGTYNLRRDFNRMPTMEFKNGQFVRNIEKIEYGDEDRNIVFRDPIDFICAVQDAATKVNNSRLFAFVDNTGLNKDKEIPCITAKIEEGRIILGHSDMAQSKINVQDPVQVNETPSYLEHEYDRR